MAKVTLEKVSKFYGDVEAVKKIDLEIQENLMNTFPTRILSEILKNCDTICKIPTRRL